MKRISILLFIALLCASVVTPLKASALSGSQFKAGRIIDDALFFKGDAMTSTQIQNFLNAKVPSCDTNGAQPYGGTTRKAYAASKGVSTPFICLKSYKMNTPTKAGESGLCSYITPKTNRTAAQIIDDVARACGVSQKALLVLIEKEQSLVTDDWPWPVQYRSATGYGCPDTAPCDAEYYGFFNQVYSAARQFKRYAANPTYFNHRPNRTSYIKWHPNSSCGGSNVYIENQSTAGLYNYTPYRPNTAALNNLYGTGDSCSSYGNRNFWRLYNDWFGSPYAKCTPSDRIGENIYRLFSTKYGQHFYTAYQCEANNLDATSTYKIEGVAYKQPSSSSPNTSRVYRLKTGNKYFWTANTRERDRLVQLGYTSHGTAFYGFTSSSTNPNKIPVYRLYNSFNGNHLWTSDRNERNVLDATSRWRYEGIAYYMLPTQ